MTPNQLAGTLRDVTDAEKIGKSFVRPYLRKHFTRDETLKSSSWNLTPEQIAEVTAAWDAKQNGKPFDRDAFRKQPKRK
jgi:hypothetical protein